MTTLWVWGTGWVTATLVSRQRAPGLDRCAYSGGPAHEVRGRLLVPLTGPWLLGRACASRRRYGEGAVCVSAPLMVGAYGASGCTPRGRGRFCAGGDFRRRRGRESCPRTRGLSPAGRRRTRPRGMSPPAYVMRSSAAAAEACNRHQCRRSPVGRRSGARLEDVGCARHPST